MESTRVELRISPEAIPSPVPGDGTEGLDALSLLLLEFDCWRRERRAFERQVKRLAEAQSQLELRCRDVIIKALSAPQASPAGATFAPPSGGLEAPEEFHLTWCMELYEKRLIEFALARSNGCQRKAAAILGMLPTTLNTKVKRLGVKCARHYRPRLNTIGAEERSLPGGAQGPAGGSPVDD